jgi:hypothetical protein
MRFVLNCRHNVLLSFISMLCNVYFIFGRHYSAYLLFGVLFKYLHYRYNISIGKYGYGGDVAKLYKSIVVIIYDRKIMSTREDKFRQMRVRKKKRFSKFVNLNFVYCNLLGFVFRLDQ